MSILMMTAASISVNMDGMETIATIAASCAPLSQEPLSPEDAEQLAGVLKAIADPARLRLLSLIQAQPDHEACVCHLTEPLGLGQPTVSHHLKVLLNAGLVERDQRGNWAYFRVVGDQLRTLRDLLV
jgi:ArsR family transcriptional regulator, arsenate/arsenite/antimonite-responsive transcriptional repressor